MTSSNHLFRTAAAFAILTWVGCKDHTDPGGTPTTLEAVTAAPTSAIAGDLVSPVPSFVVKNENGQAMAANVTVTVTGGGGSLTGQPVKSVAGATGIGSWRLGKTVGTNAVTVSVGALTPITFTVAGTVGAAFKIVDVTVGSKSAPANTELAVPILVSVRDSNDNTISAQNVQFSVLNGGGSLTGNANVVTDGNGTATSPAWRLGKTANTQTMRAISGAIVGDVQAFVQTNYNILLRFNDAGLSSQQQQIIQAAADRIKGIVTGELADVQFTNQNMSSCQVPGVTTLTETVDDLLVYVLTENRDGLNGALASAGPCFVRVAGSQPVIGKITLDLADLPSMTANNTLVEVVMHELMHVLGLGSLWGPPGPQCPCFNLVSGSGSGDPRYTGAQGRQGCLDIGGTVSCSSTVPLEAGGGGGTVESHWRESTFATELLTGFYNPPPPNALSLLTVRSLADMNYVINPFDADQFNMPGLLVAGSPMPFTSSASRSWEGEFTAGLSTIDQYGRAKLVRKPK